jgi:G:T-mismatch repair DNA endonuclease (very short patch repair protein)
LVTNSSSRNGRWSLLQKSYGWRTRVVWDCQSGSQWWGA